MTPLPDITIPAAAAAVNDNARAGWFIQLRGWLMRLLARRAAGRVDVQLSHLDDRLLDDIGLTRTELTSALTHFRRGHGPF